jgi:hypothetical protein
VKYLVSLTSADRSSDPNSECTLIKIASTKGAWTIVKDTRMRHMLMRVSMIVSSLTRTLRPVVAMAAMLIVLMRMAVVMTMAMLVTMTVAIH